MYVFETIYAFRNPKARISRLSIYQLMWIFTALLFLLHITVSHGFYRIGSVNYGGVRGTIYLIDADSIFLTDFSVGVPIHIMGTNGGNSVTVKMNVILQNTNMMINSSIDLLVLDYITIVNGSNSVTIASFPIQNNIYIPCSAEYLGQFSRNGAATAHSLDGFVFLDRSTRRFFVAGLVLDGSAPAVYFWLDTSATPSTGGKRAGYNGVYNVRVNDVNNQDANVTVPPVLAGETLRSLSVWCEDFAVSFGHVNIPVVADDGFTCSTTFGPVSLGLTPVKHQVSAEVHVLGPTTIGFEKLYFDGNAPATWYWSGTTSTLSNGFIVPDHTGSLAILGSLTNASVVVTLPAGYDVCNTEFISVYCVRATVNFGDVRFSSFGCSGCPIRCKTDSSANATFQCRDLSTSPKTRVEYRYNPTNSFVTLRLLTCGQEANQYVAFGISGSDSSVSMAPDGDVGVCHFTNDDMPVCIDYRLMTRSQCSLSSGSGSGACPDTVLTNGTNNYMNTAFERVGTRAIFTTMRQVTTGDANDKAFTPGTPQYIIWARGGTFSASGNQRWVLRHEPSNRASTSSPIQIDFGNKSQCDTQFECDAATPPATVTAWTIPPLCIDSGNNIIEAAIGNTGGQQGYKAITNSEGWGIAWYLNGMLIPEVYVKRGTTVKFYVNGGDTPAQTSSYHPFYITDSATGGILGIVGGGAMVTETVYAGIDVTGNSVTNPTVGKYCNWDESTGNGDAFTTFTAYKDSLSLSCGNNLSPRGVIEWTPSASTPELLYYQCATHQLLGWKIHVVDDLASCIMLQGGAGTALSIPITLLLLMSLVVTVFYTI